MTGYGIVAHVSSGAASDWRAALRNLSNLYRDESVATRPADIAVVVNGDAVRFLRADAPESDRVARATDAGVAVLACANSLARLDVPPAALAEGVETVPAGVAELVRLQTGDNAYLKLP